MRSPEHVTAAYRAAGRKVTPQRARIFRVLHDNPSHPTAEAVHAAVVADMPSVSLRTVYSTLHELAEMGEINPIQLGTGSTRFDPNVSDHDHLVCDRCGTVVDVELDHGSAPVSDVVDAAAPGFRITATQIVLRGTCASCAAAETASPESGNT